jgi:hypothetical protein
MFLRMGGFPINVKKPSLLTSVCNALVTLHGYAPYLEFLMGSVVHREDLWRFMKTFRSLNCVTAVVWLLLRIREIK